MRVDPDPSQSRPEPKPSYKQCEMRSSRSKVINTNINRDFTQRVQYMNQVSQELSLQLARNTRQSLLIFVSKDGIYINITP